MAINDAPIVIRVPKTLVTTNKSDTTNYTKLNKYKITNSGNTVAIIGVGDFYQLAQIVKK